MKSGVHIFYEQVAVNLKQFSHPGYLLINFCLNSRGCKYQLTTPYFLMIWNWNLDMKLTLLSDDLELKFGYEIDNKVTTGMKKYNYDNMIMFF